MIGLVPVLLSSLLAPGDRRFELQWEAPPSCPDRASVETAVRRCLAGGQGGSERIVRAHGRVTEAADGGFALRLQVDDGATVGERELAGPSCGELAEAAALVVALAVDPTARAPEADRAPPPAPAVDEPEGGLVPAPVDGAAATPTTSERATPLRPSPAKPRSPGSRPSLGLSARGGVVLGLVEVVTGSAAVAFSVQFRRVRLELHTDYLTPRTVGSSTDPTITGRVSGFVAGVRVCPLLTRGRVDLLACGGFAAGFVHGRGREGLARVSSATAPLVLFELGPALAVRLHPRVGLWLEAMLLGPVVRPAFSTLPSGEVLMRLGRIGGQVLAGVEVRLR